MLRLRELRIEKGMTQQELSAKTGIAQGIISDIESGSTRNPRLDTVMKLASALDCSVYDFVKSEPETV